MLFASPCLSIDTMNVFVSICLIAASTLALAGESPAPLPATPTLKGTVLEIKDVDSYTYLRLMTKDGETWAAVSKAPVKKGAEVTIENVMVMTDFESKSLKKTFPKIVFGALAGAKGNASTAGSDMSKAHAGITGTAATADTLIPKASGANAYTVADVVMKGASLKNKPVLVRGKIVKYNPGIMGKNWIHLRDGSGSATDGSNDILVTTSAQAKTGDVLTVNGIVNTDVDFGSGYAYKVLIQEATLVP